MSIKWIGAILVVLGCGGVGFTMAANYRREEWTLRALVRALDYMTCELQFRLTPLPQLCRQAGRECGTMAGRALTALAEELESQTCPDADGCMNAALSRLEQIPGGTAQALLNAGWCGVRLLATAHAASWEDFTRRPLCRGLWEKGLFEHLLICRRDKSRGIERVDL